VGVEGQEWYLNGVASIRTGLEPRGLLERLLHIEADMGRVRKKRWEPRILDLDLLLYDDRIIREKDMEIPHPRMHLRKFVLVPLSELVPEKVHPVLGETILSLLNGLKDDEQIVHLTEEKRCCASSS
jgi:2-amino-4-hydroxy-6-hydroxymethyldihydropteridine diphosphokinase